MVRRRSRSRSRSRGEIRRRVLLQGATPSSSSTSIPLDRPPRRAAEVPEGDLKDFIWRRPSASTTTGSGKSVSVPLDGPAMSWTRSGGLPKELFGRYSDGPPAPTKVKQKEEKARRALARQAVFGTEIARGGEQTILEKYSIGKAGAARYEKSVSDFDSFAAIRRLSNDREETLGNAVALFFKDCFMDGDGAHVGNTLLAALKHLRSHTKKWSLPRAEKAIKGWRRLCPPNSRLPIPRSVVAGIVNELVRMGHHRLGVGVWLSICCYLRPGELLSLEMKQIVGPAPGGGSGSQMWSVLLHPREDLAPSKTGSFDDSVPLDLPEHPGVIAALSMLKARLRPDEKLVPMNIATYERLFNQAATGAGVSGLDPLPYCLRHTGPSHDRAENRRSLMEVKKRGRWASDASVRRYEKGGRVSQRLQTLSLATQRRCADAESHISMILGGTPRTYGR